MLKRIVLCLMLVIMTVLPQAAGAETFEVTLARFEAYAKKGMRDWKVPGMVIAAVKGDRIVYAEGFGTKRFGSNRPVTKDTVFQVGSTTKAFTVALMAALVDEGKVGWDDRVVDHYPGFMMYDPWVTKEFRIHDLFAQHSGMPSHAADLQVFIGFGRDHILKVMRYIKPVYSFRDKFSYVNNLFVAGAKVVETKTGKSWETLMQQRILGPLGMTSSSTNEAGLITANDRADLHIMVDGKPTPLLPEAILLNWPYIYGPAGGLNASAPDMARWLMMQMGRGAIGKTRIFSEQSADYMHAPRTPAQRDGLNSAYCQGWIHTPLKKIDVIWHNGGTSGICAFTGFSPDLGMALVVLTNLGYHKLADALGFQFFEMMSGNNVDWNALYLKKAKEAETVYLKAQNAVNVPDSPGLPPHAYEGTYVSPIYGSLDVRAEKRGMVVRFGAEQQISVKVEHKTMHIFKADLPFLDPGEPGHHFDFSVNAQGDVTGVIIREFDHDGTGTFIRK